MLGLPFSKINGAEPSFNLTGSHSSYNRSGPGSLLKQIAFNKSASPVILVDEIDKPSGDHAHYPLSNALLDLLEPINAKNFKDEFFQLSFDASKTIWLLTANTVAGVPEPLLSRVAIFDIPMPDIAQRKRIIESDFHKLCQRTGAQIEICDSDVIALANRIDLDLRKVTRLVRDGFIQALRLNCDTVKFDVPPVLKPAMGFY